MNSKVLQEKVETKKLKEFIKVLPIAAIGGLLLASIISLGMNEFLPQEVWESWLMLVIIGSILQILISAFFMRANEKIDQIFSMKWRGIIAISCVWSGLAWGGALSAFYPLLKVSEQPYLIVIYVIALSCHYPVLMNFFKLFCLFAIALATPFMFMLIQSDVSNSWLSLIIGYLGVMVLFSAWASKKAKERIQLQYELFEQNQKVEAANESKSKFLASASHDLRQPLQALGFYIVMLSDYLREPRKKALFDKTLKAYQALENLLNQLLNISKLNANLIDINEIDFSVKELFSKLKNDYEMQALDMGLNIEFASQNEYVYSDITSVERILRNLIENALRYTKFGFVKVSCIQEQDYLKFDVADTGIGIENNHLDKIFDEFYQVKNPERDRSKGFGLGLYAVARLAKLLGTEIDVESQIGKGSRFTLRLPVGKEPVSLNEFISSNTVSDNVLFEKVVLLVDDDDVVLDSISRLVLSWGCLVLTADSYEEAVELITQEEIVPDFLIVDYRLPNYYTGVELVETIRERCHCTIPAVILTGDTGKESLSDINRSGIKLLHKPADPKILKSRVKSLLESEQKVPG
ncbi:hybrid sensor histidine kinase/response regulator [Aliikangiella sp. G2MR2-5]|uniref:ATP-binding response regulator n=1 Tax=Aliikangiella sp. G2MR2-5 TaxID=2788943 RepID=UPI0018ABCF60|nr:hybrid sensor histidine kinase/response regulator [Aliikangiella sp. G2MR2-5]